MEKMTCFYDQNGSLINIGEWNYMEFPVFDNDGFLLSVEVGNPLPDGAIMREENVETNGDGSRSVIVND